MLFLFYAMRCMALFAINSLLSNGFGWGPILLTFVIHICPNTATSQKDCQGVPDHIIFLVSESGESAGTAVLTKI